VSSLLTHAQATVEENAHFHPNVLSIDAIVLSSGGNYGLKQASASILVHREPGGSVTWL
jgi:hypothetical protein